MAFHSFHPKDSQDSSEKSDHNNGHSCRSTLLPGLSLPCLWYGSHRRFDVLLKRTFILVCMQLYTQKRLGIRPVFDNINPCYLSGEFDDLFLAYAIDDCTLFVVLGILYMIVVHVVHCKFCETRRAHAVWHGASYQDAFLLSVLLLLIRIHIFLTTTVQTIAGSNKGC